VALAFARATQQNANIWTDATYATTLVDDPMMNRQHEQRRLDRRRSFNEVAALYDRARPAYPTDVVDAIVRWADIQPESTILEIGCGSGQLTVPLAAHGASIIALELGSDLAAIASLRTAPCPRVQVIEADFDRWSVPRAAFHVVVAATSFHWLDPDTRLNRCLDALRPDGALVIVETHWSAGSGADEFFTASQECYAQWDPNHDPDFIPTTLDAMPTRNQELEASQAIHEVRVQDFFHAREYTTAQYCALLGTFSDVHALGETSASGLLACIAGVIDTQFAGAVVRKDMYRVWSARKNALA
jgi:SAM-dependent methyltransferase